MRSQKISWDLKRFWFIIRVCGLRLAHRSYSDFQYFFMSGDNFWVLCWYASGYWWYLDNVRGGDESGVHGGWIGRRHDGWHGVMACDVSPVFLIKGYFRRCQRLPKETFAPGSLHWILCCEGFPKQNGIFSTGLVLHDQAQLDQYLCICVYMYMYLMYIVVKLNGLLFF